MKRYHRAMKSNVGSNGTSPFPINSGTCGRLTTNSATSIAALWLPTAMYGPFRGTFSRPVTVVRVKTDCITRPMRCEIWRR